MKEEPMTESGRKQSLLNFFKRIRLTRSNFGWWILGVIVLIFLVGIVNSWIHPETSYFEPFIWILGLLVKPFGFDTLGSLDYRFPLILRGLADGLPVTLFVSLVSVIGGFLFAVVLAMILVRKSKVYGLKYVAQGYIDFFRSTPLLVQILLVYFGISGFFPAFTASIRTIGMSFEVFAGTLALGMNTAAYQAEIIRGGILAIPVGQTEAARGLGLTTMQTMRYVILPQAVRIVVPPLTNELINVLLNSSLIMAIGVVDLTKASQTLQARHAFWQVYLIAAAFYFFIAFTLSKITKRLEVKLRIPGLGVAND